MRTFDAPRIRVKAALLALTATLGVAGCGQSGDRGAASTAGQSPTMIDGDMCVDPPSPTASQLDDSLQCFGNLASSPRAPILLVPGTATTPDSAYSWNKIPALQSRGDAFCTVTLPDNMLVDVQTSAEYFAHAVDTMFAQSRRPVQVIGYSQGGMMPRWAIKYFPDVRPKIEELITYSASNHGTVLAAGTCVPDCAPAIWQQRDTAALIATLNAGQETFDGIDYTSLYTRNDEVVVPNTGPSPSSALRDGGSNVVNIALQDVCPLDASEHLTIGTFNAVAWALTIDALDNPGPADPARLAGIVAGQPGTASACAAVAHEGVDQTMLATNFALTLQALGQAIQNGARVPEEPPIRCYARQDTPE